MKRLCLVTALALLAALGSTTQLALTADAAVPSCDSWSPTAPNVGSQDNELHGVTFRSSCDGWAVGMYRSGGIARTLIEHWNGTKWVVVPSPSPGSDSSYAPSLSGVTATASSDAWAVGGQLTGGQYQTLIEHWNGHTWTVQTSKNPGGANRQNSLTGVAALSPTNVWAVGTYYVSAGARTLIEHWNGTSWSVVASPNPGSQYNVLQGISAVSASNIWAVGYTGSSSGHSQTLVIHWNGTSWSEVPSVDPAGADHDHYLASVAATSASNVWAVGWDVPAGSSGQTLIEHWDGHAWSVQTSPNPGGTGRTNTLTGVAAAGSEAWAVGTSAAADIQTVLLHFSAGVWKQQKTPNPPNQANVSRLAAVAALPSAGAWAVGYSGRSPERTLVMHSDGDCADWGTQPGGVENHDHVASVAAASDCSAWAVGLAFDSGPHSDGPPRSLISHWNGRSWSSSEVSLPSTYSSELSGVAATSSKNAWAVGTYREGQFGATLTLILHWNGSSWVKQMSPNPEGTSATSQNVLTDVTALSTQNAWAVGQLPTLGRALILHWDGSFWVQQSTPERPRNGDRYWLTSVDAFSPTNAIVVGSIQRQSSSKPLVERWDGSNWKLQTGPGAGTSSQLFGVAMGSASSAWAVGYYIDGAYRPLIDHWNGSTWSRMAVPLPAGATGAQLTGVAAASANDAWAVGFYTDAHGLHPLFERWNGSSWKVQSAPKTTNVNLYGIAAASASRVWAVGVTSDASGQIPYVAHCC